MLIKQTKPIKNWWEIGKCPSVSTIVEHETAVQSDKVVNIYGVVMDGNLGLCAL